MVGRSLMLAVAVACCVSHQAYADLSFAAIKKDIVAKVHNPFTHLSTFVSGFLVKVAQKRLANVLPDASIPGLVTKLKDVLNAGVASAVTAGAHSVHSSSSSFVSNFVEALYGELGHLGLLELTRQTGLSDLLTTEEKDLYNNFGTAYAKSALGVIVKHIVDALNAQVSSVGSTQASAPTA